MQVDNLVCAIWLICSRDCKTGPWSKISFLVLKKFRLPSFLVLVKPDCNP